MEIKIENNTKTINLFFLLESNNCNNFFSLIKLTFPLYNQQNLPNNFTTKMNCTTTQNQKWFNII